MLKKAHTDNLISDSYNERRLSVPQGNLLVSDRPSLCSPGKYFLVSEGRPVDKAPVGRPTAAGPNCIVREPDEHSTVSLSVSP